MSDKTVKELAEMVKIPLDLFLEQLKEAGMSAYAPDDLISEKDRSTLLAHLRKRHGKIEIEDSPTKITLNRRKVVKLKQATAPGMATKTVNVEVRKQKTYIKRSDSQPSEEQKRVELAKQALIDQKQQKEEERKKYEPTTKKAGPTVTPAVDKAQRKEAKQSKTPAKTKQKTGDKASTTKQAADPKEEGEPSNQSKADLEAAIERNAAKVRKQAEAKKQQTLHKKKRAFSAADRTKGTVAEKPATPPQKREVAPGRGHPMPTRAEKKAKQKKGKQKKIQLIAELEAKHQFEKPVEAIVHDVTIPSTILLTQLAQQMSVKVGTAIKELMNMGTMATINQSVDQETAAILVEEMGHRAILQSDDDLEREMLASVTDPEQDDTRETSPRAPIVTIMGHVDHGKTLLLDYIRKTRVASGEAGGITQHIGAYQVKTEQGSVTFLDTPGHAAFTAMRARGAEVTDIVIVVVAADDGVMPQTKEAVEHAKAADVPLIVAINKMDKAEANPDKVMKEMAALDVVPEEWGGETQFLQVSAKSGEGIDVLIEALTLQTEILELNAPTEGAASGAVIEAKLDKGRGAVATILVQKGCLEKGQMVLCGHEYGRIRAMFNENGIAIDSASPSTPVEILGLSGTPEAGDKLIFIQTEKAARELAEHREVRKKFTQRTVQQATKLDDIFSKIEAGDSATLNLVIKTDVQGSLEALRESLIDLSNDEVSVKCVYGGVGGINESDVNLALASRAVLMGFNVRADATARKLIQEKGIDTHYYSIIYEAIDDVKRVLGGMLAPEIKEQIIGLAEVRDIFKSPKLGAVAGCMVIDGVVKRNSPIRVLRDNTVIYEGNLESLRRFKDDTNEVKMGMECGICVKHYNDVKNGDQIEVFERVEIKRELE